MNLEIGSGPPKAQNVGEIENSQPSPGWTIPIVIGLATLIIAYASFSMIVTEKRRDATLASADEMQQLKSACTGRGVQVTFSVTQLAAMTYRDVSDAISGCAQIGAATAHSNTAKQQDFLASPVNAEMLGNLEAPCRIAGVNFTQAQLLKMTMGEAHDALARCEAIADAKSEAINKQHLIENMSKSK